MKNKKLIIDKDNYKGYTELYKKLESNNEKSLECVQKGASIFFGILLIGGLLMALPVPFMINSFAQSYVIGVCGTMIIGLVPIAINFYVKDKKIRNKGLKELKEKYHYLDINIDFNDLYELLDQVNLIKYDYDKSDYKTSLNTEEYENYLKCEEIKKEYLSSSKYDGYIINPPIEEVEIEKPMVKKLKIK